MTKKLIPLDQPSTIQVDLDDLLELITRRAYDATHIGGLTGHPEWVVDVFPLLDHLTDKSGLTEEQMKARFDAARVRVHGPNVKGGR